MRWIPSSGTVIPYSGKEQQLISGYTVIVHIRSFAILLYEIFTSIGLRLTDV